MIEPFWQRSLGALTYDDVAAFVDERVPEGDRLEYKEPTYDRQSGRVDLTDELLETFVAFANGGGGLLIYGVRDGGDKRPAAVDPLIGVDLTKHKAGYNLDQALPDACAARIDPPLAIEVQTLPIPQQEEELHAGYVVVLARVRPAPLPPYNLRLKDRGKGRGIGIYIRVADTDRLASVREIGELFNRRELAAGVFADDIRYRAVFGWAQEHQPDKPPILMVGVAPTFPIEPVTLSQESDDRFRRIGMDLFHAHYVVFEPHGIVYDPGAYGRDPEPGRFGCAYDDGTIGVQVRLATVTHDEPDGPHSLNSVTMRDMDILGLWRTMRWVLEVVARWPREACGYGGPLRCRFALGNIANVGLTLPEGLIHEPHPLPRNRQPGWTGTVEWGKGDDVNSLLDEQVALLARQLQFPYYQTFRTQLRSAAEREGGRLA